MIFPIILAGKLDKDNPRCAFRRDYCGTISFRWEKD